MKHASHFVLPGAKKFETDGGYEDILAYKNSDNSVIIIITNQNNESRTVTIKIGNRTFSPELKANLINTLKLSV
jgi:glucosylceramidase